MERRVVITGLGAVTPIGNDVPTFWENAVAGKNGIGPITKFDTTNSKVNIAAEVKDFNPLLYMEKPQVRKTDLFTQYALAAADQAMQDSGIAGKVDPERLGVYVGSGVGGMDTFVEEVTKLLNKGPKGVSPFFITKMITNIASGNIAIKHNAQGPSMCVVTACATSANAVGEAFRAIKHGYADAMIAGGAEATINEMAIAGFANCMALCTTNDPENASMPFDKRRSGFVMGEGSAVLILEEYEHAVQRGAKIYAEVCGYGNTNDAHHVTAPHPEAVGPANAVKQAMREAGIPEGAALYINAHGTSTPLNDKTETLAFKKALGEERARQTPISSTKSMTGHMLGATGALEAIVCTLALQNGVVPPTIHYQEADPECDLDYVPNTARKVELEYALSTNLGFGGHNACLAFKKYNG
ncbi:beta-ketoacyl-ACP synthase II [Anaeromassilibacillus senegalensis]|uniref:beta-ketoacyl-ACP synthase II n=1 Tax=Anaeromassilibacillus senegalensis TaxID=1673717 RepID=UPI00067FC44A|nr:beta-ketoacyl-ACP synthase II [Anaeromassilibacillus senegalensis]